MNNDRIIVINEQGEEIILDVLFTFDSAETKKSYIVYTNGKKDEFGNVQVFASIYDPKQEKPRLEPIETEKEWQVIETILNSLQENVRNAIHDKEEMMDEKDDIIDDLVEDDFEILNEKPVEEAMGNFHVAVKLHFYEKKVLFDHSPHVHHEKIGVVGITGESGKVTIGSSIISDIVLYNDVDINPIHVMLVIVHGKVFISNMTPASSVTLNHQEIKSISNNQESFYELKHGEYFTMGHRIKVYMEITNPEVDDIISCPLCGNEYFKKSEVDQCCIDCRKQMEEEMALDVDQELEVINLKKYDSHNLDYLGIVVMPTNQQKPKIFESMFKRMDF